MALEGIDFRVDAVLPAGGIGQRMGLETPKQASSYLQMSEGVRAVIIHDAVRPLIDEDILVAVAKAANEHGASGAVRKLVSTILVTDKNEMLDHSLVRETHLSKDDEAQAKFLATILSQNQDFQTRIKEAAWGYISYPIYHINEDLTLINPKWSVFGWRSYFPKQRDQLLRKARRSNTELDWSTYKRSRNRVNNLVKSNKARYKKELLRDNADSAEKFWSAIKKIYPTKETSTTTTSMIEVNGQKMTDTNEIANAFSKHFATVANALKAKTLLLRNFIWMPQKSFASTEEKHFRFQSVNPIQVYNELNRLKRKKAVGVDNFPSGMIKDAASFVAEPLTYIINMSIETGLVPSD
eukprot:gene14850-5974_t